MTQLTITELDEIEECSGDEVTIEGYHIHLLLADTRWHRAELAKARAENERLVLELVQIEHESYRRYGEPYALWVADRIRAALPEHFPAALAPEGKEGG